MVVTLSTFPELDTTIVASTRTSFGAPRARRGSAMSQHSRICGLDFSTTLSIVSPDAGSARSSVRALVRSKCHLAPAHTKTTTPMATAVRDHGGRAKLGGLGAVDGGRDKDGMDHTLTELGRRLRNADGRRALNRKTEGRKGF